MNRSRKEFPNRVKVAAFKRADGKCEGCGGVLRPGKFTYDHHDPDGLTGEPTLENCRVLCDPCHTDKSKRDVALIAEAKRREAKLVAGVRPRPRQKIPSPPKAARPARDNRCVD